MHSADSVQHEEFFVTGGTLLPDAPSYVERQADRALFECLLAQKYCYVLTARQMGKSSLIARTAVKLRAANINTIILDLAAIGRNLTIEQWYGSLLNGIGRGVNLSQSELEALWKSYPLLSPAQRWIWILREVILKRYRGPLVIFIDEVDYVLDLPFPLAEFFAVIRECYNLRTAEAEMKRVTFSLVGVAMPSDLISDDRNTPFNIGERIELHDFTADEAMPLARGLEGEESRKRALLMRVLYWTGGHPYLTQRLCQAITQEGKTGGSEAVDHLCNDLFFTRRAQEFDDNLLFVRGILLRNKAALSSLLDLSAKTRNGTRVADDRLSSPINALRHSGILCIEGDRFKIRNRIYDRVFNEEWIKRNLPDADIRR